MAKRYLKVKGMVDMYCPHCGKILWSELDGKHIIQCNDCNKPVKMNDKGKVVEYSEVERLSEKGLSY